MFVQYIYINAVNSYRNTDDNDYIFIIVFSNILYIFYFLI